MARAIAAVLARCDSSRLPGKPLKVLGGRAMIGVLTERLRAVPGLEVVVTTTDRAIDDPLAQWAQAQNLECFRGPTEDVLGRVALVAKHFGADVVVRANGDSPLLAAEAVAAGLAQLQSSDLDFVSGKSRLTGLPVGLAPEFLSAEALERLDGLPVSPADREHVTQYIFEHPDDFCWQPLKVPAAWKAPEATLTVDTPEDFRRMERLIAALGPGQPASWGVEQIIAAAKQESKA